jgi:uncharacterized protein YciI
MWRLHYVGCGSSSARAIAASGCRVERSIDLSGAVTRSKKIPAGNRTVPDMRYFVVIRERSSAWNWSVPMRRQEKWDGHAAFMDALAKEGFIVAGGPLGGEDDAARVMHVVNAAEPDVIEARLAEDPWEPMGMLKTVRIEPWTVLLGGFA